MHKFREGAVSDTPPDFVDVDSSCIRIILRIYNNGHLPGPYST